MSRAVLQTLCKAPLGHLFSRLDGLGFAASLLHREEQFLYFISLSYSPEKHVCMGEGWIRGTTRTVHSVREEGTPQDL